jgi:uncharacterized protein YkwD
MKKLIVFLLIIYIVSRSTIPLRRARGEAVNSPAFSTAYELVDAVNAVRASHGLPPYSTNSILMGIAQRQAEYNLAIGCCSHLSSDGSRPFQRALQAGYLVAGDLSQGGYFSENIVYGVDLTASEAVEIWMMDAPHQETMLSSNHADIGAGVAVSGNSYYYVIDCGLSTDGSSPVNSTSNSYVTPDSKRVPNTPNADGSITYTVQTGDILGSISETFGISLTELRELNGLTNSIIYPNQILIIRGTSSPTPTLSVSPTPTGHSTITPWLTSTPTSTILPISPTSTPSKGLPVSAARGAVISIILVGFSLAALLAALTRRNP